MYLGLAADMHHQPLRARRSPCTRESTFRARDDRYDTDRLGRLQSGGIYPRRHHLPTTTDIILNAAPPSCTLLFIMSSSGEGRNGIIGPDVIVDEDADEYNDAFDLTTTTPATTIVPPTTNIDDGGNVNGPSRYRTNVGENDDGRNDDEKYSTTTTGPVLPSTFSIEDDDAHASSSPEDEEGSPIVATKASSASMITALDENDESISLPEEDVEVEEERRKRRQLYPKRLHLDDDDDDEETTMNKSGSTTSHGINGGVVGDENDERTIMEVSVALEALEAMRRLNLEMEFAAAATKTHANKTTTTTTTNSSRIQQQQLLRHDDCTFCQREKLQLYITKKMNSTATTTSSYNTAKNDIVASMELDDRKNRGDSTTTATTTTRNGLFSTRIIEDDLRATNSPGFDPVFSFDDDDDDTVDDMPSGRELLDTGYFSRRNNNSNGGGVIDESSVTRSNCDFDSGSGGGSDATKIGKREIMGSNEVSTNSNNTFVNGDKEEIVASDNGDDSRMIRRLNSNIGKLFSFRGPATAPDAATADVVVQDTINNDVKVRSETAMMIEALADSAAAAAAGKKKVEKKPYRSIRKNEIDDNGRCVYHNEIQLQKHTDDGLWITVRKKCPECITEDTIQNKEDTSSSPAEMNTTTVSSSSKNTEIVVRRDNHDNNSTTRTTTPDDRIHRSFFSRSAPAPSRPPPLVRNILKKVNPCLTCGHPTCPRHSSSAFSKNNIPMCQQCAYLFELDFIVEIVTSSSSNIAECRRKVDEMVDCYDRAKLLLSYTAAYAEDIALALEAMSANSNMIGAGSSVTSIGSGIASIVGCGILLLVPPAALVGVHLMVAGLVVGGGATAVQTGDEMVRYYSEPNRLAERMVALHGMATSLLRVREVLSHVLLKSNSYDAVSPVEEDEEGLAQRARLAGEIKVLMEKHNVTEKKGNTATAKLMGKGARYIGRICSTASVIPVAGGILSAASIYFEGNELKKTITRISEGSPCDKAQQVRSIRDELDMLPDSSLILEECRLVFDLAQKEKSNKVASSSKDV